MSFCEAHDFTLYGKAEDLKNALLELQKDENFSSWFDPTIEHYGNNSIEFETPEKLKIGFGLNYLEYIDPVFDLTKLFPIVIKLLLNHDCAHSEFFVVFNGEVIHYNSVETNYTIYRGGVFESVK